MNTKHLLIVIIVFLTPRLAAQDYIEPRPLIRTMPPTDWEIYTQFLKSKEKSDTIYPLYYPFFSKEQIVEKLENLSTISMEIYWKYSGMSWCISHRDYFGWYEKPISYICPVCEGETIYKTIHNWLLTIGKQTIIGTDREIELSSKNLDLLYWNSLNDYRKGIKEINGIHVTLDESEFCKYCSPLIKVPKLNLLTKIEGETNTNKIANCSLYDIELLRDFLNNNLICFSKTSLDYRRERLKELLGIKDEIK